MTHSRDWIFLKRFSNLSGSLYSKPSFQRVLIKFGNKHVVRWKTKCWYGRNPPSAPISRLEAFQLKGLRKILGTVTTYIDRSNTNEEVVRKANLQTIHTARTTNDWRTLRGYGHSLIYRRSSCSKRPCRKDSRSKTAIQWNVKLNQIEWLWLTVSFEPLSDLPSWRACCSMHSVPQVNPMELALCSESEFTTSPDMNLYVQFLGFLLTPWRLEDLEEVWSTQTTVSLNICPVFEPLLNCTDKEGHICICIWKWGPGNGNWCVTACLFCNIVFSVDFAYSLLHTTCRIWLNLSRTKVHNWHSFEPHCVQVFWRLWRDDATSRWVLRC